MRRRTTFELTLIATTLAVTAVFAAIPDQTPEQLEKGAEVIVVGTVQEIHAERTTDELWDDQTGTVLFLVEKVEKGDKLKAGDQLQIGFWTKRWVGPEGTSPPTYGGGHRLPKPDPNAQVRAYVDVKEDGSYEARLPNGLVPLSNVTAKSTR